MSSVPYTLKPDRFSSHTLLLEHFPSPGGGSRVLDVGAGEGYLSRILAARGYQVVCLAAPGLPPGVPPGVALIQADLDLQIPEAGCGFSFVLCGDVLEHLRDPLAVLRWLRGLLGPGGRLVTSLPNSGHAYFRLNVLLGRFPSHARGLFDRTHLHFFTWRGWNQLLAEAGFRIEAVRPTAVPFGLVLPRWADSLAVRLLERISYGLGRIWKTMFAYQFVVTARPHPGT